MRASDVRAPEKLLIATPARISVIVPAPRPANPYSMTVATPDKDDGTGTKGVVITKVDPKGAAADKGLKKGDIILEVAGKTVASPDEVRDALEAARTDKKSSVLMRLRSGDASRYIAVPVACQLVPACRPCARRRAAAA